MIIVSIAVSFLSNIYLAYFLLVSIVHCGNGCEYCFYFFREPEITKLSWGQMQCIFNVIDLRG